MSHKASVLFFAILTASCAEPAGAGARCIADADCDGDLRCYSVDATSSRRCLASCDPAAVVLCTVEAEGSVGLCAALDETATAGACLVGGEAEPGETCAASLDCATSGICVVTDGEGICERACDTAAPECAAGETCTALVVDERRGYCALAQVQDGGV